MGELRFEEIARKVIDGEMSQQMGADALGMKRSTFAYKLNRRYPDRPKGVNIRKENRRPVVGRPPVRSYLERVYTDKTLCMDLKCTRCPMKGADGKCRGPEGLIKAMLERGPLKDSSKVSEARA